MWTQTAWIPVLALQLTHGAVSSTFVTGKMVNDDCDGYDVQGKSGKPRTF